MQSIIDHNFETKTSTQLPKDYCIDGYKIAHYKICNNCFLEIFELVYNGEWMYDVFFLHGREIFEKYGNFNEIKYTCSEIIIKNIIE